MTRLRYSFNPVVNRLRRWAQVDQPTGPFGVLLATMRSFGEAYASQAAASLSYYALFTLFPLVLLLIAVSSTQLATDEAVQAVTRWIGQVVPVADTLIEDVAGEIVRQRTSIGIISAIGLLWAASGFFTALVLNVDRAFPHPKRRGVLTGRLLALLIVGLVLVLFVISLYAGAVATLSGPIASLLAYDFPGIDVVGPATRLAPIAITFVMFAFLYKGVPKPFVPWRAALVGSLAATLIWQIAIAVVRWVVAAGLVNYQVIYGSLATVVALLLWVYVSCWILLFGAHLTATLAQRMAARAGARGA